MYRVVLGLEVLGNPVGFVKGLKEGAVGLFYHPIQVIQNLTAAQDIVSAIILYRACNLPCFSTANRYAVQSALYSQ